MPAETLLPRCTHEPPLGCGCIDAQNTQGSGLPCGMDRERALEWLEDRGGPLQLSPAT